MENMVEKIIAKHEEKYNKFKSELEGILKNANDEYNKMLNDYNSQINFVKNDNGYSDEGKSRENKRINDIFSQKLKNKSCEYYDQLISKVDAELNKREKEETESYIDENDENYYSKKILNEITNQHLNSNMLVQLTYVNSMLNSINSLEDADMLDYVYKFACVDKNFSDEIINMIYLKARNIINSPRNDETDAQSKTDAVNAGKSRSKVMKIIDNFNKYNYDYLSDISEFKKRFSEQKLRGHYPGNIFTSLDFKRDFNTNIVNSWGNSFNQVKSNDPWGR